MDNYLQQQPCSFPFLWHPKVERCCHAKPHGRRGKIRLAEGISIVFVKPAASPLSLSHAKGSIYRMRSKKANDFWPRGKSSLIATLPAWDANYWLPIYNSSTIGFQLINVCSAGGKTLIIIEKVNSKTFFVPRKMRHCHEFVVNKMFFLLRIQRLFINRCQGRKPWALTKKSYWRGAFSERNERFAHIHVY